MKTKLFYNTIFVNNMLDVNNYFYNTTLKDGIKCFFKKYDYLNVNILLYSDAKIKKMRANKVVIGNKILNKREYEAMSSLYDNLEFDNILAIDE